MELALLDGVQLPVDRDGQDVSSFSTPAELRAFVWGLSTGSVALPGEVVPVLAAALGVGRGRDARPAVLAAESSTGAPNLAARTR